MRTAEGEKKLTPEVSPLQAVTTALEAQLPNFGEGDEPIYYDEVASSVLQALRDAGYVLAVSRVQWRR